MLVLERLEYGAWRGGYAGTYYQEAVRVDPLEAALIAIRKAKARYKARSERNRQKTLGFRSRPVVWETRWHRTLPVREDD